MATELMKFRGYYEGSKAEFIANAKATADEQGLVVYIQDKANNGVGSCIYAMGTFFGNFQEFVAALAYVKGVKVGSDSYNAATGGGYVEFASTDPTKLALDVQNGKLTFGLTEAFVKSVNDVIAQSATIFGDYLTSADKATLEGLIATAKSEAIAAVVGTANDTKESKTIEGVKKYVDEKTADIASNSDFSTLKGRVDTIEGDYLKNADKEALQGAINTEKGRVDAIVADYLKAADKTELANSIKAISDDYLKAADKAELNGAIKANEDAIKVLEGNDKGKSAREIVQDEVANQLKSENISESFDTLKEMAEYLSSHPQSVTDMNAAIKANADDIKDLEENVIPTLATNEALNGVDGRLQTAEAAVATVDSRIESAIAAEVTRANGAYDEKGAAAAAESAAKSHAETKASAAETAAKGYADGEVAKAKTYAEEKASAAQTAAQNYADGLAGNYATKAQGQLAETAAQAANVYTKTEVDSMLSWVKL
jgi:hypothetical protein